MSSPVFRRRGFLLGMHRPSANADGPLLKRGTQIKGVKGFVGQCKSKIWRLRDRLTVSFPRVIYGAGLPTRLQIMLAKSMDAKSEVQVGLYADCVKVYYKGHFVERMARVHGDGEVNVNYRHVINSLVHKPGAFSRYQFREQLFPTRHFRLTYDALKEWRGERADVEYVGILHLAATTMETNVDSALSLLLEAGKAFDYAEVRDLAEPKPPEAPALVMTGKPNLKIYDGQLTVSLAGSAVCG